MKIFWDFWLNAGRLKCLVIWACMALVNRYGLKRTHLQAPLFLLCREKIEVRVQLAPLNCNINPSVRRNTLLGPQAWDKSGNADVIAFHPWKFEKFLNLIYNIYTRSGELRTFFLSFLSDSPDRSGKYTKALFWIALMPVGQVGIKYETSFNKSCIGQVATAYTMSVAGR